MSMTFELSIPTIGLNDSTQQFHGAYAVRSRLFISTSLMSNVEDSFCHFHLFQMCMTFYEMHVMGWEEVEVVTACGACI